MKKLLILASFVLCSVVTYAQPQPPNNPVPLDGGISLLIAAGAAFGAKKVYDVKKAND